MAQQEGPEHQHHQDGGFIESHLDTILSEWEAFAATRLPAAQEMNTLALRDHAPQIPRAVATDLRQPQTATEQTAKSRS